MPEHKNEFVQSWRCVLGAFMGIAGGFASLYFYAAGLFIKPMSESFGWTRAQASFGAVAMSIGCVLAYPIAGRIADKLGVSRVAFVSAILLSLSFVILGTFTVGLTSFVLLVLMLTVLSSGSTPLTYNALIVMHFERRRGLALGIALTGTGVGAVVVPAVLTPLIAEQGWRMGYFALAAVAFPVALVSGLFLRGLGRIKEVRAEPAPWLKICRQPAVLTIATLILLAAIGVFGSTLHLVPMLTDRGFSPALAGAFASSMGLAIIFGRVITGYLLDRYDAGVVTAVLLLLAGCGQLCLSVPSPAIAFVGAVLLGFGLGTESDLVAYLLGRRVAPNNFATAYGAVLAVHAAGAGIGGYLAGLLYDLTGDYLAWLLLAATCLAASAAIAIAKERGLDRKRIEVARAST